MEYLIPENLNLEKILEANPPKFKFKHKLENFYFILDYLSAVPAYNRKLLNIRKNPKGYIPIYAYVLQDNISNYLEYLLK